MQIYLAGLLLALGIASAAGDFGTIYAIRKDASYLQQADKVLTDAQKRAAEQLADAQVRRDAVAEARAKAALETIQTVARRSNVTALARQLQQDDESFRKSNWGEFLVWFVTLGGKSVMHPLNNAWEALGSTVDLVTLGKPRSQIAQDAATTAKDGMETLEREGPLPRQIEEYLRKSIWTRVKQENSQIRTLPQVQQDRLLCEQSRKRIGLLLQDEKDPARLAILQEALKSLEAQCSLVKGKWVLDGGKGRVGPKSVATVKESGNSVSITQVKQGMNGRDLTYNMAFAVEVSKPPSVLIPGTTITLTADATFRGFISPAVAGPAGGPFEFRSSPGVKLSGQTMLDLLKKKTSGNDYASAGKTAVSFRVPDAFEGADATKGEMSVTALVWNCTDCYITWVYKPQ